MQKISLFWFRRDLRINDNAGLYHALKNNEHQVLPIFIFDQNILQKLENKADARVNFIHQTICLLKKELAEINGNLLAYFGDPLAIFKILNKTYSIANIYTNEDYEPYAKARDKNIADFCNHNQIKFYLFKDQCIFDYNEVLKDDGKPYTVFTPYSRKWKEKFKNQYFSKPYPNAKYFKNFFPLIPNAEIPTLAEMGFSSNDFNFPNRQTNLSVIKNYKTNRNFPSVKGTSKLSLHFRFGTISIREKANKAALASETWLNELIWRDFYMMILAHFPHAASESFKPIYNKIAWRNDEKEFKAWCDGQTGYPIVDAGMRELNSTGFMHNRVRMIVASFLTKHLLIDWRWGEAYFAATLLDFDLSANNGGWQWAAGSGCDAAPYFRIFNPTLQTQKFDPQLHYVKKWVTEIDTTKYPKPIVEHAFARKRCLAVYKNALAKT